MGKFVIGMHVVGAYKEQNAIPSHAHNTQFTCDAINFKLCSAVHSNREQYIEQEQHYHRSLVTYKHCGGEGEHHFPRPFF